MTPWMKLMVGSCSFVLAAPFVIGGKGSIEQPQEQAFHRASSKYSLVVPGPELLRDFWSTDPSRAVSWDQLLNRGAIDLVGAVQQGDWSYVETLADLQDPSFVSEGRLGCGDRYATAIESACSYRIEMVLERVDELKGKIVYSRVVSHERHLLDQELVDADCDAFVMCLAGVRLGSAVSMPPGKQRVEVSQELYSSWADERLYDPGFVGKLAGTYERHVASLGESPSFETPMDAVEYRFFVDIVPYLRKLEHELSTGRRQ